MCSQGRPFLGLITFAKIVHSHDDPMEGMALDQSDGFITRLQPWWKFVPVARKLGIISLTSNLLHSLQHEKALSCPTRDLQVFGSCRGPTSTLDVHRYCPGTEHLEVQKSIWGASSLSDTLAPIGSPHSVENARMTLQKET